MAFLVIPIVLASVYGLGALLHAVLLIPGGAVKAHVNLLAACGNATLFLAAVTLLVSDSSTLETGWFWLFVTAGSAIHFLVLSFYLYTDRTARMGGFVCDLFANTAILLVIVNETIADNAWVQGMVVLWAIALKGFSAVISILYRYRLGFRPVVIIVLGLIAKAVVVVGVLLSPAVLFVGPSPVWDSLICGGLIVDHVVIGILCMWYTEANDSLRNMPAIAIFMGVQTEIDRQRTVEFNSYEENSVVIGGRVRPTAVSGFQPYSSR